jgi:hypothetical protein
MTNEIVMAKIASFIQDLKEAGIEDVVISAGNEEGFLGIQYDGDPRAVAYLAMTALMNIMFDSMAEVAMEVSKDGREDHSE